ncbi:MAG: hypothetical protein GX896_04975, partial [Clostridiales bacterium]|nr:hypothetical protein [Clostridiales bacterium]
MTTVVSLVLFFTSDILMLINILLFSTSFHSTKLTDRKFQVIFICFIHLIYAVVFKTYYHEVNSYITFIMVFLFYFRFMIFPAFLNPKFTISFLYLSLFLLTIQSIIKKASLLVLRSIFIVTDLSLIENLPPLTLQFAVFIILILICRQKILKNSKLALSLVSKSTWTLILACFFIMSGLITLLEMNTAKILLQKGLFKFILVLFILTLIVIIASLMLNNILKNHYANNTKILENEINNQITHKKQHESFKKEFYAFKHDYENQMHCISSLIIENKNNEAVSYIDQLHKMPLFKKQQFDTGNSIVDAILSDKYSIAQNHEIAFSCKGS